MINITVGIKKNERTTSLSVFSDDALMELRFLYSARSLRELCVFKKICNNAIPYDQMQSDKCSKDEQYPICVHGLINLQSCDEKTDQGHEKENDVDTHVFVDSKHQNS